ncbi:Acyl-protein thioesterase 1 [Candida tropicalis]
MPAWFDIYELGNPNAKQDIEGFFKSCDILKNLVKQQIEEFKIPPEKIIIGGFSQGAAISLATLATMETKIGGCVALSGFCALRKEVESKLSSANLDTPIFQGHGTADPVINYQYGKKTSEFFKELGFKNLDFQTYPGVQHSASDEELAAVIKFIKDVLEK